MKLIDADALRSWLVMTDKTQEYTTDTGLNTFIRVKDVMDQIRAMPDFPIPRREYIATKDGQLWEYYDKEETHNNCTVQVLTNTRTGKTSVGWWRNK